MSERDEIRPIPTVLASSRASDGRLSRQLSAARRGEVIAIIWESWDGEYQQDSIVLPREAVRDAAVLLADLASDAD